MAWTESNISRRQNIADLARSLAGAKGQTAEQIRAQTEAKRGRRQALLQQGVGIAADVWGQKKGHEYQMEQIGEEARLRGEQYKAGSPYADLQVRLENMRATAAKELEKKKADLRIGEAEHAYGLEKPWRTAEEARKETELGLKGEEVDIKRGEAEATAAYYESLKDKDMREQEALIFLIDEFIKHPDKLATFRQMHFPGGAGAAEEDPNSVIMELLQTEWFIYSQEMGGIEGRTATREGFEGRIKTLIDAEGPQGTGKYNALEARVLQEALKGYMDSLFGEGAEPPPVTEPVPRGGGFNLQKLTEFTEETGIDKPVGFVAEKIGLGDIYEKGWGRVPEIMGELWKKEKKPSPPPPQERPNLYQNIASMAETMGMRRRGQSVEEQDLFRIVLNAQKAEEKQITATGSAKREQKKIIGKRYDTILDEIKESGVLSASRMAEIFDIVRNVLGK